MSYCQLAAVSVLHVSSHFLIHVEGAAIFYDRHSHGGYTIPMAEGKELVGWEKLVMPLDQST